MIEATLLDYDAPVALSDYETERGKPMPDKNHAIIQSNLLFSLRVTTKGRFSVLPELHLNLPKRDRVPDLAIYEPLVFNARNNELKMSTPPLCAIEILSEVQSISELIKKCDEYFTSGIQSYWLVLPALESIYVFYSIEDSTVFTHKDRLVDKMLDIELDLSDIFR
jgi:Uma2 family endonuclease